MNRFESSESFNERCLKYFQEVKEDLVENSKYLLEVRKDTDEEKRMINELFVYLSNLPGFGDDYLEFSQNRFDRCYNLSFKSGPINIEIVLTYIVDTTYSYGVRDVLVPVIKIKSKKTTYLYENGDLNSIVCYDNLDITTNGIYGSISNFDKERQIFKTLIKGDVVIPDNRKNEASWLKDISNANLLRLSLGINTELGINGSKLKR